MYLPELVGKEKDADPDKGLAHDAVLDIVDGKATIYIWTTFTHHLHC